MAARTFRFLTSTQVQRLHLRHVSPNVMPTQPDMLESAIHSPMNMKHYARQENVFQLAANLAEKIMKNHSYQDGNKRTALVAADMFLKINGYYLQKVPFAQDPHNKPLASAHVAVVTSQWTAEQLGNYYQSVATPLGEWTPEILEFRNAAVEY